MTLDEAIKHAEEVSGEQLMRAGKCTGDDSLCDKYSNCMKCAEEHQQLAEWLRELKKLREQTDVPDTNVVDFKQAVLDVITHELMCGAVVDQCGLETAYDLIKELPPEKRTEERTETHACDCISRQAAIDALSHMMDTDGFRDGWAVSRANVDCMLRYLPSVEPERKTGKWIIKIEDWNRWTCSECGFSTRTDIHVTLGYDYCPKCGAPMEVDG